jgi:hypothetical protein
VGAEQNRDDFGEDEGILDVSLGYRSLEGSVVPGGVVLLGGSQGKGRRGVQQTAGLALAGQPASGYVGW